MVQLLTDEDFVEGLLGGLGGMLAIQVKQLMADTNVYLLAVLGFMSVLFTRMIGLNLYREHKKLKGRGVSSLDVNVTPGVAGIALLVPLLYFLRPPALLKNLNSTGTMVWVGVLLSLGLSIFFQR
jgi:hypothetical protein